MPAVSSSMPAEAKTKPSLTEQVARVNEPGDESMTPLYQQGLKLFSEAFGKDKAVTGYGRAYPAHSDTSAAPVYRAIGQTAENALGRANAVNGNGTRPPGHLDESMGPAEGELFRNMNHDAVADTYNLQLQKEGFTYKPETGTFEADGASTGVKMAPVQLQSVVYSLGAVLGRCLYDLIGGDPIALEKTEADIQRMEKELEAMNPMTLDKIYVEGHPEKTGENITRYLYQQLGNQVVKVPVYYILGKIESIAALTGISAALLTSQIHADIIKAQGEGDPYTAAMYGVPLSLLVLLKAPFKVPLSIKNAREFAKYLGSVLLEFGVDLAQQAGVDFAIDESEEENKNMEDPSY